MIARQGRERVTLEDVFAISRDDYPGDLLVANAHTSRVMTLHTGEGDSEVILCTDTALYYRVNDSLFEASIGDSGIGPARKIAQGPEVVQAHWAFLRSQPIRR